MPTTSPLPAAEIVALRSATRASVSVTATEAASVSPLVSMVTVVCAVAHSDTRPELSSEAKGLCPAVAC